LVDTADADVVTELEAAGIASRAVPLFMTDVPATAAMAERAINLAQAVRRAG
jgi:LPPG:FO 2-phospho-L-lactate transferase